VKLTWFKKHRIEEKSKTVLEKFRGMDRVPLTYNFYEALRIKNVFARLAEKGIALDLGENVILNLGESHRRRVPIYLPKEVLKDMWNENGKAAKIFVDIEQRVEAGRGLTEDIDLFLVKYYFALGGVIKTGSKAGTSSSVEMLTNGKYRTKMIQDEDEMKKILREIYQLEDL